MPINTGNFAKALWPGVNAWYGKAYDEHRVEYTDLFTTHSSRKAYEEDVGVSGLGLAAVKPEGNSIAYDNMQQGYTTRYNHVNYGLGFIVTKEAFDDDQYDVVASRRAKALAFSMRQTKEIVAANVYNRAFNTAYEGGDGSSLVACASAGDTNHPLIGGTTLTNGPAADVDISEAALEQACIDISKWTDERGLKISVIPEKLIITPDQAFEADRILNTPLRVGTANNDINALKNMGKFPGGIITNHYLTGADDWFIMTNIPDGMKHFERTADSFDMDNDFDTDNAKFKATGRYSFGWTDWRAIYGAQGA